MYIMTGYLCSPDTKAAKVIFLQDFCTFARQSAFLSCPMPLFQSEAKCEAMDMTINFHSHSNKTHFNKKGFALSLLLKMRVFGIQKIPISTRHVFKTGTC